ncbi:ferritin-1, chloroplastic-like [Chenopodium quinoa]|uniref:ferritin-1, chloroplastic-like n=1 Tax=Chenopodium quinoa TaxID=63459 RepID=UPI000B779080|nr:ferritin-1, chloroplastic-like [Chenopodium quinoa]
MLLRASPAFSLLANNGGETNSLSSANSVSNSLSFSSVRLSSPAKNPNNGSFSVSAAAPETNSRPLTGVIFEPFEEVKKELSMVPIVPQASLARQKYADDCESAINEQIK